MPPSTFETSQLPFIDTHIKQNYPDAWRCAVLAFEQIGDTKAITTLLHLPTKDLTTLYQALHADTFGANNEKIGAQLRSLRNMVRDTFKTHPETKILELWAVPLAKIVFTLLIYLRDQKIEYFNKSHQSKVREEMLKTDPLELDVCNPDHSDYNQIAAAKIIAQKNRLRREMNGR